MVIIEKSTVLISLGMCKLIHSETRNQHLFVDYFIWNQSHLHLLDQAKWLIYRSLAVLG